MSQTTISQASVTDRQKILEMWTALTLELEQLKPQPFGELDFARRSQQLEQTLDNALQSDFSCVFYLANNGYLGTISVVLSEQLGFTQPQSGILYNLWVAPEYRAQGYGAALVKQAKAWLQEQGARSAQVGWYVQGQEPMQGTVARFWQQQGFSPYEVIAASPLT